MMRVNCPALLVAAASSGSGKTFVTLALLRALSRAGVSVVSAKAGPDYIDPAFHTAASGVPCLNIDPWAMRPARRALLHRRLSAQGELLVAEGVMGLFDAARDGTGSSADLACGFGWPVVMVIDVRGQTISAVAALKGFVAFRKDVNITAVIFNRVGGESHRQMLAEAMAANLPKLPILGYLPRRPDLALPERYLGLVQAREMCNLEIFLNQAADWVAENLDLDLLVKLAQPGLDSGDGSTVWAQPPLGQRIAIARDDAFAFCYPAVLDDWREAGSELSFFSPLADAAPDSHCDAIYLPGGYPELHAARLAKSRIFLDGLHKAAGAGKVIFGECGGYMVLGESLTDADGRTHRMAGLLPVETSFATRRLHLGYRRLQLLAPGPLGAQGQSFRGHEFHYASITQQSTDGHLFEQCDARGQARINVGHRRGSICGSFLHLIDQADG